MQTLTLTGREDFGFVERSDEGSVCTGQNSFYCLVIDDASVYFRVVPAGTKDLIYQAAVEDSPSYPGMPTGRIPAFYRALVAQRRFSNLAGRTPSIGELVRILSVVDGAARGDSRADDAWATNALVRANLKLPMTPQEQGFIDQQAGGGSGKGGGGGGGGGSAGGGGAGMVLGVVAVVAAALLLGRR